MGQGSLHESIIVASDCGQPLTGLALSNDGTQLTVSVAHGT